MFYLRNLIVDRTRQKYTYSEYTAEYTFTVRYTATAVRALTRIEWLHRIL